MTTIRTITIDCTDAEAMGRFWKVLLGWPLELEPDAPSRSSRARRRPESAVPAGAGAHAGQEQGPSGPGPVDRSRDEEVDRLLEAGATIVGDHRKPDGTGWVVMADPEGNEFCVERSDAERSSGS